MQVDADRLRAIAPQLDLAELERYLRALAAVADGDPAGGPLAALPQSERFGALSAPASTVVQPSEVHTGVCDDPAAVLEELFERLVPAR
jgi:hypothetical protein